MGKGQPRTGSQLLLPQKIKIAANHLPAPSDPQSRPQRLPDHAQRLNPSEPDRDLHKERPIGVQVTCLQDPKETIERVIVGQQLNEKLSLRCII